MIMNGEPVGVIGRYDQELAVMKEMGWSWPELQAAPADLVHEILIRAGAREQFLDDKKRLDNAMARQGVGKRRR